MVTLDENLNAVFNITDTTEKVKVAVTVGTESRTDEYDISGLTLEEEEDDTSDPPAEGEDG